ncbi:MAG: DNA internalization-related competence protein ComEC/Rec2 [Candidatus Hydrogenedentota bacterium]|nr:MAG: DNA internalization-related competence protein ComEC/Rec2 [Candidatus Hydrogenedentota bacterium]
MKKRTAAAALVVVTCFFLGVCLYLLEAYVSEIPDQLAQHYASERPVKARLTGVVTESLPATNAERLTFTLDVEGIEVEGTNVRISGHTLVNWYQPSAHVEPGDVVEVDGKLKLLRGFKNPHTFDYERYMYRRGVFTRMFARGPDSVIVQGKAGLSWPLRWREYFRREGLDIISSSTRTDETRAFISAILLGERGLLTKEMKDWFRRTGTFHVLAISGLHVGLVYLIASLALTPLPVGARSRVAAAILIVWVYAFVTGGSVPVTRASIMLTLVLAGYYFSREGDFLTAVALAAFIIVAWDPVVIDEIGFHLSFTAMVLLCTFEPLFSDKIYPAAQQRLRKIPSPILHKLTITLFASLVVGIGMLPLVAYHFNLISFVFPIANLIVVPVLSLVLASGFACLFVGFLWSKAAVVFGLITEALAWAIFATVKLCSMAPASSMYVGSPPLWVLGLGALALALVWSRARPSYKVAAFAAAAVVALSSSFAWNHLSRDTLRATFLDVGDADSCFLEYPGGETMLVDTGFATPYLDCGERLIAPFLWRKGNTKIGTLVLTHSDADHTGGASFIIRNFRIGRLLLPKLAQTSPQFLQILRTTEERGFPVERVGAGDALSDIEGVRVDVFNPPPEISLDGLSDNETSVVLQITYGETKILLTGDAEKRAFRLMHRFGQKLGSQILKAPHHGLASSFNRTFLEAVRPELVVISGTAHRMNDRMGRRVSRYASVCETVLSTQDVGAVTVESDGRRFRTRTARKVRGSLF